MSSEISSVETRPRDFTRIELPEERPVIDVMCCCGPEGAHVWLNLYRERGAFLTIDQALALARALTEQAGKTHDWISR